jgi:hypothetical protein
MSSHIPFDLIAEFSRTLVLFRENPNRKIYLFGGYQYFSNISYYYGKILDFDFFSYCSGFIDNDENKCGQEYCGLPIILPSQMEEDCFVIISCTNMKTAREMERELVQMGLLHHYNYIYGFDLQNIFLRYLFRRTRQWENHYTGKRCFILGNGPSLNLSDIEKLYKNNEIVFASNAFYKYFDDTAFRPNFYFIADERCLENREKLYSESEIKFFIDMGSGEIDFKFLDNVNFYQRYYPICDYPFKMKFSDDLALLYFGGTITYAMLQCAVIMGFSEIYLLGIDNSVPCRITPNGELVFRDDIKWHFYTNEKPGLVSSTMEIAQSAYQYARDYCENRGITIYNATRGGELEIFKRADFDSLFEGNQ